MPSEQIYVFLFLANATHYFHDRVEKATKLGLKLEKKRDAAAIPLDRSTQIVKISHIEAREAAL
ncbi:hypothetical protein HDV06_003422 [Boothiomyces sp. JEL0866]|nr:hypothetical protein HDV06_003374 [Boothiomyces sp. JEL0866]KAJ3325652.1 hypothetical protein HDV06_003422 [Boothiomyces sp. JEL0866]